MRQNGLSKALSLIKVGEIASEISIRREEMVPLMTQQVNKYCIVVVRNHLH